MDSILLRAEQSSVHFLLFIETIWCKILSYLACLCHIPFAEISFHTIAFNGPIFQIIQFPAHYANHRKCSLIIDRDEFKITLITLDVIGLPNKRAQMVY